MPNRTLRRFQVDPGADGKVTEVAYGLLHRAHRPQAQALPFDRSRAYLVLVRVKATEDGDPVVPA